MNKTIIALTTLLTLPVSQVALAHNKHGHHPHGKAHGHEQQVEYGKVTHVEPVYEWTQSRYPSQSCWYESQPVTSYRHHDSATPVIVGAVIGGALGNAMGHSRTNKRVGTAVGAVIGGSIGADIGSHSHSSTVEYRSQKVCETRHRHVEREQQLVGYNVTYLYDGEYFTTFTESHPGNRIRLRVSMQVDE